MFWKRTWLNFLFATLLLVMLWGISALGALRTFLPHTLSLIGWPGTERNYLILFQNDTELRPTGGFITAYAVLSFKHGFPTGFSFQDVYGEIDDHPYIKPPYPLDVLLEKDSETYAGHTFRDANFYPDFAQSKVEILKFFHINNPEPRIDGLFAINFSVLEDLLELYEPVNVQARKLTRLNLFETLENAVSDIDRHNLEALSTRKSIIRDFAKVMLRKMAFSPWKWRELSEVVSKNLNEKSILLSFENETLSKKMHIFGWDGTLPKENPKHPTDRLIVNVSNYGGMKSDRYMTREVHYKIDITKQKDENDQPIVNSTLNVTLTHHGDYNTPLSGEYKGYLKVFVPEGAELMESSTGTSVADTTLQGYAGWGDVIKMQPGETLTYTYRFQLNPRVIRNDHYELTVVKQPGTKNDFYDIVVHAPVGRNLSSEQFETTENLARYKTQLKRDAHLELQLLEDEMPPRLFWQRNAELNVIELSFAEDIDSRMANDPLNYEIRDLNKNVPEITDTLTVDFIEVFGGAIRIHTKGMSLQPEEHYQIFMRNLRDLSGNPIHPNPRTVTVVQRLE